MPLGQASGFSRADPGGRVTPRFRHRLIRFRHFIDGSLALASLNLACRDHGPDVSATLTTIALDDSSLRWLETCTRLPASKGPPSSLVQFRTVVLRRCLRDTRPVADLRRRTAWKRKSAPTGV